MKKIILFLLVLFSTTGCFFGVVDAENVYRSPQLDGKQLQQLIDEKGIKTIINLRGDNPDEKWFQEEKNVADKNGLTLVNISMSARSIPHRSRLLKLLDALRDAPKPILIHCKAGVDRTGEASALYQMIYLQYSKKEALKMLSTEWGHIEKKFPAKKYFIREVWKDEEWAREHYYPCKANYKFYDKNNSECSTGKQSVENLSQAEDT